MLRSSPRLLTTHAWRCQHSPLLPVSVSAYSKGLLFIPCPALLASNLVAYLPPLLSCPLCPQAGTLPAQMARATASRQTGVEHA